MEEKRLLSSLADSYNMKINKLKLLREGGCVSYSVWGEGHKFFMKAIPPAFMDTAVQSLNILMYLDEKGFPAPHVITAKNGSPYVELNNPESKAFMVLFDYIDGREPEEGEDLETLGVLVGQLHSIMSGYKGNLPEHGREFFIERYINILKKRKYDQNKIEKFREYGETLWSRIEHLPRGFCHGDLHRGNVLRTVSGKYYILDFDTACNAFPIYDIMVLCNSTNYFDFDEKGYQKSKYAYETFLNGYTKYLSLSNLELQAFYDLIAVYHYQLQATIIEIYGLEHADDRFLDKQLEWLMRWREQCQRG